MTVYGIDFGTCFSCIAVAETGKETKVIPTAQGENMLPSVVEFRLRRNGTPRVGSTAKNAITPLSRNVAAFLKTEMDQEESSKEYEVREGEVRHISPIEFASCVYKTLYKQAQAQREADRQETSRNVVITVPAACSEIQREKTKVAAEIAGMNVMRIINEPTAAAVSYNISEGETIMVFDLGGGTHDVSIVQRLTGDNYQVVATKGDSHLGGKNWDEKLVELVYQKLGLPFSQDVLSHARLIEFEKHKINLCSSDDVTFAFMDDNAVQHQVSLSLEEFEEFTEQLVEKAIQIARDTVDEVFRNHPNITVNRICMSGGTCRMSVLKRALHQAFPRMNVTLNNPDKAIATGAAIYALSIAENGNYEKIRVNERGHAYGFKTLNQLGSEPLIENFISVSDPLEITSRSIRRYMSTSGNTQRLTVFENAESQSVFPLRDDQQPFFDGNIRFDHVRSVGSPLDIVFRRDANGIVTIVVDADGKQYEFTFATTAGSISGQIHERAQRLMELLDNSDL